MDKGKFVQKKHRAFAVLLYYSAVRKAEALRVVREQFQITRTAIMFDVGERLKHGKKTNPLKIPFKADYVEELREAIDNTAPGQKVFPYSPKTGYNIIHRAFNYPHLFRLSRITNFFLDGWTIAQIKSWTGLTLAALEYYVGLVDTMRMGDSLAKNREFG